MPTDASPRVTLRDVTDADLPIFFEHQLDADAVHMAAFTAADPTDQAAFNAHWARIRGIETIVNRTILVDGEVAGHISRYGDPGSGELTYWLGREYWGRGVATAALAQFLTFLDERPLYARAAKDNRGSVRVLQKCGFEVVGEDRGFANARGEEIEEVVLKLEGDKNASGRDIACCACVPRLSI